MTNSNQPALQMQNLSVYYGNTPALQNVKLTLDNGEYLGNIGQTGG